jgi:uncharacterized membrane protein YfcA
MNLDWILHPRDAKDMLFLALTAFTLFYVVVLALTVGRARREGAGSSLGDAVPTPARLATGFVTNFFDTLGIGSFATTTSIFKFWKMIPDERIPGTLNVGHTLPTIAQAYIYTRLVPVEARTLILMIAAAVIGAWLGAGVVASWPRRTVQLGMGACLFAFAIIQVVRITGMVPGGTLLGVEGTKLGIAIAGNFMLGALMTLGIGLYAPCLILVSMLGMNPTAGFPIMMGSCAFLMPISSARFIQKRSFHLGASLGLMIGGIPAVLIAAFIVKSLPLTAMNWLVLVVIVYTATSMILSARRERVAPAATPAPAA